MTTLPESTSAPDAPSPYDPEMKAAGQLTSPTWELELFLSGAFVFATFQLPGLIESAYARFSPHTTTTMDSVLFLGTLYAKAIAFTLMAMFSVHLALRAYWVALMGLQSVFPGGIRWDELRVGPIARQVYERRTANIGTTIAKLDNFCSVVFSVGLLLVVVFLYATLLGGTVGGVAFLLAQGLNHGRGVRFYFFALMSVFVVIPVVATVWDRRYGTQYPATRASRLVKRMIDFSFLINMVRFTGPVMWTLVTNLGRRKSMTFLYVAMFSLIILAAADRLVRSDRLSVNSYDYFAASRDHGVDYRYYESQREPGVVYQRVPSIQSDIIRDPYVRLFIPYYPRRHNTAVARACPGVKPLDTRGVQLGANAYVDDSLTAPVLSCLAKIHAPTLDGAPISGVDFSFYEQPSSGLKGIIAYIPADSLARGRHVLEITPAPPEELPTDTAAVRAAAWKKPYVIPFWR